MSKPATRRQHCPEHLRHETDLTDGEWNLIAPMMPAVAKIDRLRRWPLRGIMNAIFYARWRRLAAPAIGLSAAKHGAPVVLPLPRRMPVREAQPRPLMLDRQLCGREALPMASIIESQSVKARENGGSRGYNAGKRIKGRSELGSGVDWRDVEAQPRLQRASRGRRAVGHRLWEWQPMSRNGGKLKLR